jgi:hypothetical protein
VRSSRSTSQKFAAPYLQASLSSRADRLGGSVGQPFDKSITWTESGKNTSFRIRETLMRVVSTPTPRRDPSASVCRLPCGCSSTRCSPVTVSCSGAYTKPFRGLVFLLQIALFLEWSRGDSTPRPPPCKVRALSSCMFAVVRAGWCTTGVIKVDTHYLSSLFVQRFTCKTLPLDVREFGLERR